MQDLSPAIDELTRRLADAEHYLRVDDLRARLPQLETELARPDLWDDADQARSQRSSR